MNEPRNLAGYEKEPGLASLELQARPRLVIAGTGSGSGKTTVTLGLMRAFARRGLKVRASNVALTTSIPPITLRSQAVPHAIWTPG